MRHTLDCHPPKCTTVGRFTPNSRGVCHGVRATACARTATKYWVKPEDINRLTVSLVRQLPILIMDRDPLPKLEEGKIANELLHHDHQDKGGGGAASALEIDGVITSVYLDTPELELYHERMQRDEGARLYRLRWYGLSAEQAGRVFIERKTHHESWSSEASTKERLAIAPAVVDELLRGECDLHRQCAQQVARGELKSSLVSKAVLLGQAVQESIIQKQLRPIVRTVYSRRAFQAYSSNDVRITIDTGLHFVDELPLPSAASSGQPRIIRKLDEHVDDNQIIQFP